MAGAVGLVLAGALAGTARADEWDQIAALQRIKASLTPAERKLDSRLAVQLEQGQATGTREVDIRGDVPLDKLRDLGAKIRSASKRSVRAMVPASALEEIAGWPGVKRVDESVGAITAVIRPPGWTPSKPGEELRRAAPVISEGDAAHAADIARSQSRVSGVGVKVCVLSDGVDSLPASQAAGELPDVHVLPGQEGEGDEGTAMLEIVHDLAPKAELGFATAFESDASFAENIRALRFDAGCDVIVDDVLYYNESPFQDGPIAQSVNAVTADGALYFSSAGNEGNTLDRTSGNYEGDFVDSGQAVGKFAGSAHDFDPGAGVQVFEPISAASSAGVPVTLFWADPLGGAADDYDLYLFDAAGNVLSFSQDVQDGDDDPYEILSTGFGGSGLKLAVVKFKGASKYFQLSALRGRYSDSGSLKAFVSPGVTRGHSAAADAFSVAAAPAADPLPFDLEPGDPPNPSGPFPNAFTAAQLPERFTSDGPRRMFFPAPSVRQKPDITAADGVSTSLEDFTPFFGTSAAAPHAAAIAALVLSGNPGATSDDLREAFNATALDLAPAGVDGRTGHGLLRADAVLDYTGATPQPLVKAQEPGVTVTAGDGDAFLEPGETASLALPVTNVGDGTATGVNVRASSADAPVTPRNQSYGDLAAGTTRTRTYSVTLPDDYPLGKPLSLDVRVSFAGAFSPTTATFSIATGQPADEPTTFAYTGPAVPIPDDDDAGATVSIPVDLDGYAAKLTFSIDGSECSDDEESETVGIDHTYVGDLVGTLTSPSGATATLFSHEGGGGNNLCQVVFDDAAEDPFSDANTAPFTGTWRPADPLAGLMNAPVAGTWKFTAADTAAIDTGSIRAVSLHITGYVS
jgi:subtilisin-like proprotein convertase family protein